MQKSLHIDPGKCTGCFQGEMACSYENTGLFNPAISRIKVFDFHHEGRKVPYTCMQCAEAWCLNACPVGAIKIDAGSSAKVVNDAVCVGCKVCTIVCPFGTINCNHGSGKGQKCDLCGGDPACASACPASAITYVDTDWTGLDCVNGRRRLTVLHAFEERRSWLGHARFFALTSPRGTVSANR